MTLKELREALKTGRAKLVDLKKAAHEEKAAPEAVKAYKDGITDCEKLLDQIRDAEREEALDAASSKSADAPLGGNDAHTVYAAAKQTVKPEQRALLPVAAQAKAAIASKLYGERVDPLKILEDDGFGDFAKEMRDRSAMQKAGVSSTISNNVLLPQPVTEEIIPILYPATTFLQGDPRRVQLVGGKYRQPRGVGSSTASYVGEGAKKPVGAPTFDDINMTSHKLAGIVYMTNEAVKWTVGRLEGYIRDDLRRVMGLKMDSAAYFGTGAGATPTGIFAKPGITIFDGSGTGLFANNRKPTVAELDTVAMRMILSLTGSNIVMSQKWRWVMGYRFWAYLDTLRDGNGNKIFPELAQGNWKGIKILVSNQNAENGGTTTDEGNLGLVDFGHVLFAEEEDMVMKTSTEATIDDNGTLVLLWQQNMSAILCEMQHDFALDQPKAVALLTHVRAGSPSTVAG